MSLIKRVTHGAKLAAAFVVVPLALLALAEGGLRVAGSGHSTRPFIERKIDGRVCYSVNFDFFRQFMPWWPYPIGDAPYDVVIPEKAADNYRIVILGSSAAHGWYFPDFNFGRILEVMLKARFPEVRFEVYDLSYIAMNSHVMRYMAREAAAKIHPNLFVVYMGNNEMKGSLGVLHAMNMQRRAPMDWLVRSFVFVSDLRLVQAGTRAAERLTGRKSVWSPWQGAAGVTSLEDPRIAAVTRNFRDNLGAICDAAEGAGASVALCTLQRNLRDYPPDQSTIGPSMWGKNQANWEALFAHGKERQAASDWTSAVDYYRQAAAIYAPHAELQFRLGTCLWALGQFDEARAAFVIAQENNFGLLAANSNINEAVRETAAAHASRGGFLVDSAAELAANSSHQTPGHDLFFDHVHFNFNGAYLLARSVYEKMVEQLPEFERGPQQPSSPVLSADACKERLAYSPAEELTELSTVIEYLQRNSPDAAVGDFMAVRDRLSGEIGAGKSEVDLEACRRALDLNGADLAVGWRYVNLLLSGSKFADAEEEGRVLVKQYPACWRAHWALAAALSGQAKHDEALQTGKFLTAYYPDYPETWYRYGELLGVAEKYPSALKALRRAASMRTLNQTARFAEGRVLGKMGRTDEAVAVFLDLIARQPSQPEPYQELETLSDKLDPAQSLAMWRKIAAKYGSLMQPHLHFARALAKNGDADGACNEFRLAMAAEPGMLWVQAEFGRFLLSAHRTEEAVASLKAVLDKSPDMQYLRPYLAQAMLESNNPDAARGYADEARARKEPVPVDISPAARELLAAPGQP